ncbi:MAG: pyridoxal phosphate-dependent decarboxylase family protein, partial [Luteibaculum sp.]
MKSFPAYDLEHWSDFVETCLSELKSLHLNQLNEAIPVLKPTGAQAIIEQILGHGESGKKQLQSIFEFSNHLHHPGYIGHQVVPPSIPSVMAALIGNYLNQGMAIYDMGQSATAIERWVVKKLLSFFNWQEGEGIMTSGGSIGNLTALLAARQSVEDMWNEGVNPNYCVLVSADAHYCVDRAVRIMGFGSEAVVKVKPNTQHKLDAAALEEALINVRLKGKKVLAVV